jgi:hypothetical protein
MSRILFLNIIQYSNECISITNCSTVPVYHGSTFIQPFASYQFSTWPKHCKNYKIVWTHKYWIIRFPEIKSVYCYDPTGALVSTIFACSLINSVYEGQTFEECKIALWIRATGHDYILILRLSELFENNVQHGKTLHWMYQNHTISSLLTLPDMIYLRIPCNE